MEKRKGGFDMKERRKMKIVVAPDSFKGSLKAEEICEIVAKVAKDTFEDCEVVQVPMADGGEGTVESVLKEWEGEEVKVLVSDALGEEIEASYGIFGEQEAIMEMSKASGLPLIPMEKRNVMQSNTYGTGQLLADAIKKGCKKIYLGIGGSATNDLGIGCMEALGMKFFDENGERVTPVPENFLKIQTIDTKNLMDMKAVEIVIMCDVKNPLLGDTGATAIFAPQKGATTKQLQELEVGMEHMITLIEKECDISIREKEGTGAAGGLGAILLAFTNASMQSGVETILEVLHFSEKLEGANLVITGEGMMDYQSAYGKVAYGVGQMAKAHEIPCVAIVGGLGKNAEEMFQYGINSMITTVNSVMSLEEAIQNAHELCEQAVIRLFNMIELGIEMRVSLHKE